MIKQPIGIKNKLGSGSALKISRFKEKIKKTSPHKHDDYYELIFLSEGEGFHSIEDEKHLVSPPEFYLLKAGQLHFWQFTSIPKGFVILLSEKEFDQIRENSIIELIRSLATHSHIKLTVETYPEYILEEIHREYQSNSAYSNEIIYGFLKVLLGKLLQVAADVRNVPSQPQSIYNRFISLLITRCPDLHKVNEYADLLCVTPQHLNTICRKQTGKSAGKIISEQLLLEAKRYLLHTDFTINEIADALSFSDTSNFIKYIKKHLKVTPSQFRERYFQ